MVSTSLLESAIDQFGRLGFEGASTRDIARASGTAMSSITYHFGGKHGLYLATAEHIGTQVLAALQPLLDTLPGEDAPREETLEAMLALIDRLAGVMLDPRSERWAQFVIREQQQPTEAFERLYEVAMQHIAAALLTLMSRLRPDLQGRDLPAKGLLLIGQAMILRAGRASVCRALGVDQLGADEIALMRAHLRANALAILSENPR